MERGVCFCQWMPIVPVSFEDFISYIQLFLYPVKNQFGIVVCIFRRSLFCSIDPCVYHSHEDPSIINTVLITVALSGNWIPFTHLFKNCIDSFAFPYNF